MGPIRHVPHGLRAARQQWRWLVTGLSLRRQDRALAAAPRRPVP